MIPNFIKIDNQTYFADIQIGMNKVLIRYSYNISSEWEDLQQACNRMIALLQAKGLIPKPEVKRTVFQNALYWKWMEVVSEITGNNKDAIHALMKMRFLSKRKLVKIGWKRNYVNIEWSTKELSVKGFTKYLDDIYQFFDVTPNTKITMTVPPRFYFILKQAYTALDTDNSKILENLPLESFMHLK